MRRRISNKDYQGAEEEGEEWRAFRAKLVQNGLPSMDNRGSDSSQQLSSDSDKDNDSKVGSRYAYESTPLVEVGSILLSIPTTDLCQGIEQQYWHRAVVLVTKISQDPKIGELETVPDEQLAQGANRGRWSYRGILLNRFTDLQFDYETQKQQIDSSSDKNHSWNIQRGGDLLGISSSDGQTEFVCLYHGRSDPDLQSVSTQLIGNLSMLPLYDAQNLCRQHPSKFKPSDFFTFGGFCSWRPGQLEREMGDERNEWMALSVDDLSILEELQTQYHESMTIKQSGGRPKVAHGLLKTGTKMWRNFLSMIHVPESLATERLPTGQLNFYDHMLKIWAEDNLSLNNDKDDNNNLSFSDSSNKIGPGTLLRSSSNVSNDILLYDGEFIRSLVFVLEDTDDATVGIILSHPLPAAVECVKGKRALPLRYGGPIDVMSWKDGSFFEEFDEEIEDEEDDEMYEGFLDYQNDNISDDDFELGDNMIASESDFDDDREEEDEDDSSFIWIHRDAALGSKGPNNGGGTQLGISDVWMISENDAIEALQSGFLCVEDTMVFSGVCIWEKGTDLGKCGGGLREQVDALKSFEIVQACNEHNDNDVVESVWDILSKDQDVLFKETFDTNTKAAIDAWKICTNEMDSRVEAQSVSREGLSDAALRAWLAVNLLGDPLETLVEVRNDGLGTTEKHI